MHRFTIFAFVAMLLVAAGSAFAQTPDRAERLAGLCASGLGQRIAAVQALADAVPDMSSERRAWGGRVLIGLEERALDCTDDGGADLTREEPVVNARTLEPADLPNGAEATTPNLRMRAIGQGAQASIALLEAKDPEILNEAVRTVESRSAGVATGVLEAAVARLEQPALVDRLQTILVRQKLQSDDPAQVRDAVQSLAADPTTRNRTRLVNLQDRDLVQNDPELKAAVKDAISDIESTLALADKFSVLYNGLSYAAVLFMAGLGLAIIFGQMGVINLAQGEFIMLGAYTTFLIQQGFEALLPEAALAWYLIAAIPIVFLVTGGIGMIIEWAVIRHLYNRPFVTLLATWAVSLLLINTVRVVFGTQNVNFFTPFYVSGGVDVLGDFIVTWNRLFAIGFAALALAFTIGVLRYTNLGMNIRAVTQNRRMAAAVGVNTRLTDGIAFGFGAGLAGLAGVALIPIYNVNPNMGTNFVVDAFMVVVLGGVGSVLGTLLAAFGIAQVSVLIEPLYGAVAAKVIVLLLIIAFIQWRPQGLIAPKGRK